MIDRTQEDRMDNHDYRALGRGDLGKECLRSTLAEARTEVAALQAHLHAVTLNRDRMHLKLQTAATIIAEDEATAQDLRAQRAALRAGRDADATAMREATAALQAAQTEIAALRETLVQRDDTRGTVTCRPAHTRDRYCAESTPKGDTPDHA